MRALINVAITFPHQNADKLVQIQLMLKFAHILLVWGSVGNANPARSTCLQPRTRDVLFTEVESNIIEDLY